MNTSGGNGEAGKKKRDENGDKKSQKFSGLLFMCSQHPCSPLLQPHLHSIHKQIPLI